MTHHHARPGLQLHHQTLQGLRHVGQTCGLCRRCAAERMAGQVDQHDAVMRGQQGRHAAPTVGRCAQAVQHQQQRTFPQSLHMPTQARRIHKLAVF